MSSLRYSIYKVQLCASRSRADSFILAHPLPFVKNFFRGFSRNFRVSLLSRILRFSRCFYPNFISFCRYLFAVLSNAKIYYHTVSHLSTPFFRFFQESFQEGNRVRFWSKTVQKPWFLVPNQWVWCYPFLSMYAGVFGTWTTVFSRPHGGRRAILESPLRWGV